MTLRIGKLRLSATWGSPRPVVSMSSVWLEAVRAEIKRDQAER